MKGSGAATDPQVVDRFTPDEAEDSTGGTGGVGWIAYPDEEMQRASHALAVDGEVWVVDPVDANGVDDLLAEFGEVAGVVVLLDRHTRDADVIARRHDVPVYVPDVMGDLSGKLNAPVERFHRDLGDTGYAAHTVVDTVGWKEVALYGEDTGVLVAADALGTADYFRTAGERLGVHPFLRIRPPRKLGRLSPDRILVGHGAGIHEDAATALRRALDGARRGIPSLYWGILKGFLPG